MNGFLEATGAMLVGVATAIGTIALILIGMIVAVLAMGLIWVDVVVINVWVLIDNILGGLAFLPAPLSWATICGVLAALAHVGCTRS